MKIYLLETLSLVLCLSLLSNCGNSVRYKEGSAPAAAPSAAQPNKPQPDSQRGMVTFDSAIKTILDANCTSCHSGISPEAEISLSSYSEIIKSGIVKIGNAEESRLFQVIKSGEMPLGGAPLAPSDIDAIKSWINGGAREK